MLQPAVNITRALGGLICLRQYSVQHGRQGAAVVTLLRKRGNSLVSRRQMHHKTEPNVITSIYSDIIVPNCTISEYVWKGLDKWADKTAVVCGITGKGYTYGQAHKMSTAFAACLRNKLKLRDGDCVAIMLPNSPEFPLAALGSLQAGCIVTTINPLYTAEEIQRQFQDSNAKVIVTTAECYSDVKKALNGLKKIMPVIIADCDSGKSIPEGTIRFAEFAENFGENTDCLKEVRRTGDDTAFLPYSSGTTGLPKGVELMHKNITANCLQMDALKLPIVYPTTATHQDVTICVLPFFHIYGLSVTMLSRLAYGMKLVTLPKFHPETFLNAQEKYKGTILFVVPPIVIFMSSHPEVNEKHLNSIRTVLSGAAPLAASDAHKFLNKFKGQAAFMQGYGLTETSPMVFMQERGSTNYASVGSPSASTNCMITTLDDKCTPLGPNEIGELWIRGPQVMKGYYNNPTANADVFRPGGWMRTGDLAYYDEDHAFYITDRLKELIKVKGFQVAPAELEGILRSHPDLIDAAVIGVPHATYGEVPKAFVIKKNGGSASKENIMKFLEEKVASYKKLGDLQFVDTIPKNASGKILRRELKQMYA